jgi:hypothetical protein
VANEGLSKQVYIVGAGLDILVTASATNVSDSEF